MSRLRAIAAAAALAALLTACGDETENGAEPNATPSATTGGTAVTPTSNVAPAVVGSATSVPATEATSYLVSLAATKQDGHDQLVFTFENSVPGYAAEYIQAPALSDGEGKPVAVSGDNILKIVLSHASGVSLTGGIKQYYVGEKRFTPADTSLVSELVQLGDFEGQLSWAVGTKSKAPFTITTDAASKKLLVTFS